MTISMIRHIKARRMINLRRVCGGPLDLWISGSEAPSIVGNALSFMIRNAPVFMIRCVCVCLGVREVLLLRG